MELDKIIPLQETPKTPYQTSIAVPILRFRWIHAQCFQFELPGGKILMTDPFFPQNPPHTLSPGCQNNTAYGRSPHCRTAGLRYSSFLIWLRS